MTKPVLTAFLEESLYAKAIDQEDPEDYLEELCRCSMWDIPLEEYFRFIKDNPDAKGNAKAVAEWRIKKLGLDLKNEKGEKSELEPKEKEEDLVAILQADNEYLASECMEQEELIDKLAADLKAADKEKEKLIKESEQSQTTMRSIVIMHEIGHDQLHRKKAKEFHEFSIFDMTANTMEYEANLFAAQVLLPDEEILDYIYRGYDVAQIAGTMHSDINLVALKAADLTLRGYALRPQEHKRNFL